MLICTPPQWLEIVHDDPLYKEEQVVLCLVACYCKRWNNALPVLIGTIMTRQART